MRFGAHKRKSSLGYCLTRLIQVLSLFSSSPSSIFSPFLSLPSLPPTGKEVMSALVGYLQRRDLQRAHLSTLPEKPNKRLLSSTSTSPSSPSSPLSQDFRGRSMTSARILPNREMARQDYGRHDAAVEEARRFLEEKLGKFHISSQRTSEYVMEPELQSVETVCRHFAMVILPQVCVCVCVCVCMCVSACVCAKAGERERVKVKEGGRSVEGVSFADVALQMRKRISIFRALTETLSELSHRLRNVSLTPFSLSLSHTLTRTCTQPDTHYLSSFLFLSPSSLSLTSIRSLSFSSLSSLSPLSHSCLRPSQ